jgi:hypothetical protein
MTRAGTLHARAAFLTVSTSFLAGDTVRLPASLDPWREAAAVLPLGSNEKLFLQVTDVANAPMPPVSSAPSTHFPITSSNRVRAESRARSDDGHPPIPTRPA